MVEANMHLIALTISPCFLMVALLTSNVLGVNITSVDIPKMIKADSSEPIVLDCNYELTKGSPKGLVIKWFVNGDPLYQWIFGRPPVGAKEYKKYVDETFKISDEPHKMYRAVKLIRPNQEFNGKIRCFISTLYEEADATRTMLVYSPAKSLQLHHPVLNKTENRLTVTCLAEDLYPRPKIIIHQDRKPIAVQEENFKNNTEGRFDVKATAILEADKITLPTVFTCEVSIIEANYSSTKELVYNESESLSCSLLILSFSLLALSKY